MQNPVTARDQKSISILELNPMEAENNYNIYMSSGSNKLRY